MEKHNTGGVLYTLIEDMFDVLMKNTKYITQDEFLEKYKDFQFQFNGADMDEANPYIEIITNEGETIHIVAK